MKERYLNQDCGERHVMTDHGGFSWALSVLLSAVMLNGCDEAREMAGKPVGESPAPVGLVIGNGAYDGLADVTTAIADARAVARALEDNGFVVFLTEDATALGMRDALRWFMERTENEADGVFYFSGHASQTSNDIRLHAAESDIATDARLRATTVALMPWLLAPDSASRSSNRLFIVDASSGPYSWPDSAYSPDDAAEWLLPVGTMLAHSGVQRGSMASNDGPLGTYAEELLQIIRDDVPVKLMLTNVSDAVAKRTNGSVVPWSIGTPSTNFAMAGRGKPVVMQEDRRIVGASRAWQAVIDSIAMASDVLRNGDAIYELATSPGTKGALDLSTRLWPNGVVPYIFDRQLDGARRQVFLEAARHWEAVAPVAFVPHTGEDDWIVVQPQRESGGRATVGMGGFGPGIVALGPDAGIRVALHELGHTLGMHHEHNRPDRDQYVTVDRRGQTDDIAFLIREETLSCTAYDFGSVMHYSTPWLAPTAPFAHYTDFMGRDSRLTTTDVRDVQILYGAVRDCPSPQAQSPAGVFGGREAPTTSLTPGGSIIGELAENDPQWLARAYHIYEYTVPERQTVTITMESEGRNIDPYLLLFRGSIAGNNLIAKDNNGGRGRGAMVSTTLGAGMYSLVATSFRSGQRGRFLLALHQGPQSNAQERLTSGVVRNGWLTEGDRRWTSGTYLDRWFYRTSSESATTISVTSNDFTPLLWVRRADDSDDFIGRFPPGDSEDRAEVTLAGGETRDYEIRVTVEDYRRGTNDRGDYEIMATTGPLTDRRDDNRRQPRQPSRDDNLVERLNNILDQLDPPIRKLGERKRRRVLTERQGLYLDHENLLYEHWVFVGRRDDRVLITMESEEIDPLLYVQRGIFNGRPSAFSPLTWADSGEGGTWACVDVTLAETTIYSVLAADGHGRLEGPYEIQMRKHQGERGC